MPDGWTDTHDVTGADIVQVIDWAQRQAGNALPYAIALVRDDKWHDQLNPGRGRGLIWLVGTDGKTDAVDEDEASALRRMLLRRADPVVVPEADRMPSRVPDPYNDGTESR